MTMSGFCNCKTLKIVYFNPWIEEIALMPSVIGVATFIIFLVYVVLPLIFRYSPSVQRQLVFLPYTFSLRWPLTLNYSQPELYGLKGARNFYITTEPKIRVGVWHILPKCLIYENCKKPEQSLARGYPIVLYLHGNSGSRATAHRVELYKLLQSFDYHIITFDYRGFADSSQVPIMSENGAVVDASRVYDYIRTFSGTSQVIVWGHSLGTGVGTKMVRQLCAIKQLAPDLRLVLESPFSNIPDVLRHYPLTIMYRPLSFVDRFFTERLETNNVTFDSEVHIARVECPILILHAEDDRIVPIFLSRKLYQAGLNSRPAKWPPLQFIEFHKDLGYKHEHICRSPKLPSIIRQFVDTGRFERIPIIE